MSFWNEVLRDSNAFFQIDDQMPPSARHVQHLPLPADSLHTSWSPPRLRMEAKKPFCDTQRRGDFALVLRYVDAGRRGVIRSRGKHDPILTPPDNGVPRTSSIGILVKRAPAALWTNDQPPMVWSLMFEYVKKIDAKAGGRSIITSRTHKQGHFLDERAVKEVERGFVFVVPHVVGVGAQRPVDCLSSELEVAIFMEQIFGGPQPEQLPLLDRRRKNEGFVCPCCGKVFGC